MLTYSGIHEIVKKTEHYMYLDKKFKHLKLSYIYMNSLNKFTPAVVIDL